MVCPGQPTSYRACGGGTRPAAGTPRCSTTPAHSNTKHTLNNEDINYLENGPIPDGIQFRFRQTMIPSERASQEEQNDANFSSIAPSSED